MLSHHQVEQQFGGEVGIPGNSTSKQQWAEAEYSQLQFAAAAPTLHQIDDEEHCDRKQDKKKMRDEILETKIKRQGDAQQTGRVN